MPTAATQLTCAYDSLTELLCWLVVTVRHRELDETGHDFTADEIASPCVHTHTSTHTPTRTREQLIIWTVRGIASVAPEASAGRRWSG